MRESWIDNAKGIAILLVIIRHASSDLKGFLSFDFLFGVNLVVFFLLSGYTLKKKEVTKDFLNNKFSRLMKPYFYTCVAIVVTDVFNSYILYHNKNILKITNIIGNDLLRSFFASGSVTSFSSINIGTRIGAIWFLPAIFFAILLMQFLLKYSSNTVFLGVVTYIIAILSFITARFIWLPFSIQSGMMACFFLWVGYVIKNRNLLSNVKSHHYVIAFVILLMGVHYKYCGIAFVIAHMNDLFFSPIIGLAGCLFIYLTAKKISAGGVFSYIGKLSLIILCTHLYALETMGPYFSKILARTGLTGNSRVWLFIVLEVVFAVLLAMLIDYFNKNIFPFFKSRIIIRSEQNLQVNRDNFIDIVRGILIISMLAGHFTIDARLRTVIYSCHMIAFVFLSVFFYNQNRSMKDSLKKMTKNFIIPYFVFFAFVLLLNINSLSLPFIKEKAVQYFLGMSFSKRLFAGVPSVGPVYFILLLFLVRLIYMIIDNFIKDEKEKWFAVICISFLGVLLGRKGYWLPWSFDVACYSIIFYKIGLLFREKGWLETVKENHFLYFILSPVWVYMIYKGGMEITVRKYGEYGLVIIGSITGVLIVYKLAIFIADHVLMVGKFLELAGRYCLTIIFVHTLLFGKIASMLSLHLNSKNIAFMGTCIMIQVVLGLLIGSLHLCFGKRFSINTGIFL